MLPEERLADYFAGILSPEDSAAVEAEILVNRDTLRELCVQQQVDAALKALLDPGKAQLEAAIMASVHGLSNEAVEAGVQAQTVRNSSVDAGAQAESGSKRRQRNERNSVVGARVSWLRWGLAGGLGLLILGLVWLAWSGWFRGSKAGESPVDRSAARHPFLYAGEWDTRKPDEQSIFIVRNGKIVWQYSMPLHPKPDANQEFDDATLLSNGNVIFSRMSGAGMVSPDKKLLWDYPAPPGTEIHSCQSIGKDRVLIMRNGNPAQAMIINTATGKTEKEIPIPTPVTDTHGQFRHIRMTPAGTLLVPHLGEGKVVEYDLDGKVLWSVEAKSPWQAVRLKNGNTLIAGDWSRYAREVNPKGETVWEFTQADVPGETLGNIQTASRLANGNTVLCCWIAGDNNTAHWPGTVQVFEVTPAKKVVWALSSWKDPDLGPATSIQLLDEPGVVENLDLQR